MEIVSYFASAAGMLAGMSTAICIDIRKILGLQLISNIMIAVSYLCISQLSGAVTCLIACVQILINFCFRIRNKEIPIWVIVMHSLTFIAANFITFAAWYDVLVMLAGIMSVLGISQKNGKYYRKCGFVNIMLWIVYNIFVKSYGNLLIQGILLGINLLAQYRDHKLTKARARG